MITKKICQCSKVSIYLNCLSHAVFIHTARNAAQHSNNVKYFSTKTYIPHLDMTILSGGSVSVPRKHKRISGIYALFSHIH